MKPPVLSTTTTPTDRGSLWWVYVILCEGGRYYVGYTNDVDRRYRAHASGSGALFTRTHPPVRLVGALPVGSRSQAMQLERQVKKWKTHYKKIAFSTHKRTWERYAKHASRDSGLYAGLTAQVKALSALDAARLEHEDQAWSICAQVSPEIIDLLLKMRVDANTARRWLCSRNTLFADQSPVSLIASGNGASVMSVIVRQHHGIR